MLRVTFYELDDSFTDQPLGSITWDGTEFHLDPPSPFLQGILAERAHDFTRFYRAKEDPEAWLKALPSTYHGSYLWAGNVEEVE